jgi:cell division septum initiation protein DivIVA
MKVEDLLDDLNEALMKAWNLPLSGGKVLIDAKQVAKSLNEIREALPSEIRQAKAIVADRSDIMAEARKEAQMIVHNSEEKAKSIVEEDELVKQAKNRATEIVSQAELKVKELRHATSECLEDCMKKADDFLTSNLSDFRKFRKALRSSL